MWRHMKLIFLQVFTAGKRNADTAFQCNGAPTNSTRNKSIWNEAQL